MEKGSKGKGMSERMSHICKGPRVGGQCSWKGGGRGGGMHSESSTGQTLQAAKEGNELSAPW